MYLCGLLVSLLYCLCYVILLLVYFITMCVGDVSSYEHYYISCTRTLTTSCNTSPKLSAISN